MKDKTNNKRRESICWMLFIFGVILLILGLTIYDDPGVYLLGFIFFITGITGLAIEHKNKKKND